MSYQALMAERGAWLRVPVAALPPPEAGRGGKQRGWSLAWPAQLEPLLRDRPVRLALALTLTLTLTLTLALALTLTLTLTLTPTVPR